MHTAMIPMYFDIKKAVLPGFEETAVTISPSAADGVIWLDKYARRFMDESRASQHGLGHSQIMWEDANKLETPRIPMWVIADETRVNSAGIFLASSYTTFYQAFKPSEGLVDEIEKGWILKAGNIADLAGKMEVDADTLQTTIERYNGFATAGVDQDFGRKPNTMRALEPPFYAVSVYPGLLNTDGGPRRDAKGRVIGVFGEPIPHLYACGELGSIWAHHYQGSGNVGECLAFGRITGHAAAASE
jgi:succinate dehydrogenase/fumarate reductase flavoprotein subunit